MDGLQNLVVIEYKVLVSVLLAYFSINLSPLLTHTSVLLEIGFMLLH
jgi:hypothetical protein